MTNLLDVHGGVHDLVIMVNEPEDVWNRMRDAMLEMDFRGDRSLYPFDDSRFQQLPAPAPRRLVLWPIKMMPCEGASRGTVRVRAPFSLFWRATAQNERARAQQSATSGRLRASSSELCAA